MSGSAPAVVFCGGDAPRATELAALPADAVIMAVDHGLDHAMAVGIVPQTAVGDFDSVSSDALAWAEAEGVEVLRYPAAKDETDFELAMATALDRNCSQVHVVGIAGGRMDHLLANIAVLARPSWSAARVSASGGGTLLTVIHGGQTGKLTGAPGSLVSLLPIGPDAHGLTTSGLEFPLKDEVLTQFAGRGLSNVFVGETAEVTVGSGVVVALQPEVFA